MKVTILGTGTSSGIPTIACKCETCTSNDPKDKRLRVSVLIEIDDKKYLIDTSADFRQQMIKHQVDNLDAILYTHHHFDHISGFDDIRAYNFHTRKPLAIYLNQKTLSAMKKVFSYAFGEAEQIGGGIPLVDINIIDDDFNIGEHRFEVIPMMHGKLEVFGFRIGDFAYCTDTNYIPQSSIEKLKGLKYLILDALRYHEHPTHFTVDQAIEMAKKIGAERTYFTHIAHQIKHSDLNPKLPNGIELAYDGLELRVKS